MRPCTDGSRPCSRFSGADRPEPDRPVDIPEPGGQAREMQAWTAAELRRFLAWASAEDSDLAMGWRLLAASGMRRGEALALRWRDVDLDAGRLAVRRSVGVVKAKGAGERLVEGPTTTGGSRVVDLDSGNVATPGRTDSRGTMPPWPPAAWRWRSRSPPARRRPPRRRCGTPPAPAASRWPPTGCNPRSAAENPGRHRNLLHGGGRNVERDGALVATGFTGTTYHDSGLNPGRTCSCRVRSIA